MERGSAHPSCRRWRPTPDRQQDLQPWPRDAARGVRGRLDRAGWPRGTVTRPRRRVAATYKDAFAYSELYDCAQALRLAERSYALEPRSCNVAHSITHALFESGDHDAGASFLEGWLSDSPWQRGYDSHLAWHLALDELDRGNTQRSMQLYEQRLRPDVHPGVQLIVLSDAASLLWRWKVLGLQPPIDAARAVSDYAAARVPRAGQAFADVHRAMALTIAGDHQTLDTLAAETQRLSEAGRLAAESVVPAAIRAFGAFARGAFGEAADL